MRYTVWLQNFGRDVFSSDVLEECIEAAIKTGFECVVYNAKEEVVGTWSPIGGWR